MNSFRSIFKTKTFFQSSITTSATLINGALGVIFYILVARILGSHDFGLFAIAVTTMTLLADIGSVGTDTGLIRFIGKYLPHDKIKPLKFLKLGLEVKLFVWVIILVIGWFSVPFIATDILLKNNLITPLRMSLIGMGGALLFSFIIHAIQSYQKFWVWSFLNIGGNALRLILIIFFSLYLGLAFSNALIIYMVIPFLAFLLGLYFLPNFLTVKNERSVASEFFHYNKWVACFTLLAAISSRLDTFFVARFLTLQEVGTYAAALQVTSVFPQLVFAIATVVAPKLASFQSDHQAKEYLKKLQFLMVGLAILGLLALPILIFLFPLFFGDQYAQSLSPLIILFVAQIIFLLSLPIHQVIFYYFSKPQIFVWISIFHLIVITVLGMWLIPLFGVIGAAWAVLVGNIFNFLLPAIYVIKRFLKNV